MSDLIVVGIDPDSDAHGMAVYRGGILDDLRNASLVDIKKWLDEQPDLSKVLFSIENVLAQNFVYARNAKHSKAAHAKVALSVGRCQQAQTELMRELEDRQVRYELHSPTSKNWHDNVDRFKQATGWTKRSNDETRSAAFFGWLAVSWRAKVHRSKP